MKNKKLKKKQENSFTYKVDFFATQEGVTSITRKDGKIVKVRR